MQISPIQQNNTSFGMALYMPKPSEYSKILKPKTAVETEIFKKLVSYGEELEKARPQLELLAKDVDVHITPYIRKLPQKPSYNGCTPEECQRLFSGYECDVTNIGKKVGKNIFSRLFYQTRAISSKFTIFQDSSSMSKSIETNIPILKEMFIEKGYLSKK